jgi:hypothetical protein
MLKKQSKIGHERENTDVGEDLKPIRSFCMAVALAGTLGTACVRAQEPTSTLEQSQAGTVRWGLDDVSLLSQDPKQASTTTDEKSSVPDAPTPKINPADPNNPNDQEGKQPKRILGIIPNYRAVSANTHLPPLSFKEKFWLATEDTFDYSDFIFVGGLAIRQTAHAILPRRRRRPHDPASRNLRKRKTHPLVAAGFHLPLGDIRKLGQLGSVG